MQNKMKTAVAWCHEPLFKWLMAALLDLADLSHFHYSRKFPQMMEVRRWQEKGTLEMLLQT